MGYPNDQERGITTANRAVSKADQRRQQLANEISGILHSSDEELKKQALRDVNNTVSLWLRLTEQYWQSDRARRIYTKYYLIAHDTAFGVGSPSDDQLFAELFAMEQKYQDYQKELRDQRELREDISFVREKALTNPMSPLVSFEPEIIYMTLVEAHKDPMWVEHDIVDAKADIDVKSKKQALRLIYKDGSTLAIPLSPTPAMFRKALPQSSETLPVFFRRHKGTHRFIPFQISFAEFKYIATPNVPFEEAINVISPRFDPFLTPLIMDWRDLVQSRLTFNELMAWSTAFGAVSTASAAAQINPAGMARTGETAATTTTKAITGTVALSKSSLAEIRFAVTQYGISRAAVAYLGRSVYSFYLKNAIVVNMTVIIGAEIALSFDGDYIDPVSPGDSLTFAVQAGKAEWKVVKTEVLEIEAGTHTARVKVSDVKAATNSEVDKLFESGKLVHHDKAHIQTKSAEITEDSKIVSTAIKDKSTDSVAKATKDKAVIQPKKTARDFKDSVDSAQNEANLAKDARSRAIPHSQRQVYSPIHQRYPRGDWTQRQNLHINQNGYEFRNKFGRKVPWTRGKNNAEDYEQGFNQIVPQMAEDISGKPVRVDVPDITGYNTPSSAATNRLKYQKIRRGDILSRTPDASMEVVEKTPIGGTSVVEAHFWEATTLTDFKAAVGEPGHKQRQISGTLWIFTEINRKGYTSKTKMYYHIVAPELPTETTITFLNKVMDEIPNLEINWFVVR